MSIAYWCILIAAVLPYFWVAFAKCGAPGYNNKDPRGWVAKQDGYRVRNAYNAHLNAFEAFPTFAAGVLMAQFAGVDPDHVNLLAVAFIGFRVLPPRLGSPLRALNSLSSRPRFFVLVRGA